MKDSNTHQNSHERRQIERWSLQARSLWAKTDRDNADSENWLALPQHMMDSSFVAVALWEEWLSPSLKRWLSEKSKLSIDECRDFVKFLAGTHDCGKASPAFQRMLIDSPRRNFAERVENAGLSSRGLPNADAKLHHSVLSAAWVEAWLASKDGEGPTESMISLASISGAHHGLPASGAEVRIAREYIETLGGPWHKVSFELLDNIAESSNFQAIRSRLLERELSTPELMIYTGIVITADWIASNQDSFPLTSNGMSPKDVSMRDRGAAGFDSIALPPSWKDGNSPFTAEKLIKPGDPDETRRLVTAFYKDRFSWPANRAVHAFQATVTEAALELPSGGALMCIEAPMGLGKTEASLIAAEVLAAKNGSGGLAFAGPTLATTNGLFNRILKWAGKTVGIDQIASLYLGHSKNTLNHSFSEFSRRHSASNVWDEGTTADTRTGIELSNAGGVEANSWLWGRKRGILANIFVGTVDQILFSALQHKHAMLRHLGLGQKVVVIDEVHAYTEYMSSYLEKSLEWLAAYQTPVILLSATLPPLTRSRLMAAYERGLKGEVQRGTRFPHQETDADPATRYPLISTVTTQGRQEFIPQGQKIYERDYNVEYLADAPDSVAQKISGLTKDGGCALVICNTVKRAQMVYAEVSKFFEPAERMLLHAGFTSLERNATEESLVDMLGPHRTRDSGRPHRLVVVATQVVEQSLDLDFDFLISDVAPMDLILQRMGRSHRHPRPHEDRPPLAYPPTVYIRGFDAVPTEQSPPEITPMFGKVYHPAVLWKSASLLLPAFAGKKISLPNDIPRLVQTAYQDNFRLPESWREAGEVHQKNLEANVAELRTKARGFQFESPAKQLAFSQLYMDANNDLSNENAESKGAARVRDSQPSVEAIAVQRFGDGYRPLPWLKAIPNDIQYFADEKPPHEIADLLARCSVRLPGVMTQNYLVDDLIRELEKRSFPGWHASPLLRGQLPLILDEEFYVSVGAHRLRYTQEFGLELVSRG